MSEQIRRKPGSTAAADESAANEAESKAGSAAESGANPVPREFPGNAHPNTSFGEASLSVTPKDVDARDASAQDITERHLQSDDSEEKQQEMLDEAIDLTFPASDPPATTGGVTRIEVPKSPATP